MAGIRPFGGEPPVACVEELLELSDVPQNAAILAYLRGQASPPSGPDDFTLGSWQLHTHPDLMALLQNRRLAGR